MFEDVRRIAAEFTARNKGAGEIAAFTRGLDKTLRSARRLASGLLLMAGVGGIGYMIKQQMAAIDSTAKLSDRLGIATEALVGLQHGASIAGVDQGTLNKSLEIFSRRLGEVDMGVGQATYALDKLGMNYKDLIGLEMDDAFKRVADQIDRLSTQSEKAAAANYLFGRSGQALLNLFAEGSAGIEDFRNEAEKLGLTFDRIDAAKVEAANDALTRTKSVITGLFRTTTIELAPYIEAASDKFVDMATAGEGAGTKIVNAFEAVSLAIVKSGDFVNDLKGYYYDLAATVMEVYTIFDKFNKVAGKIKVTIKPNIEGAETWEQARNLFIQKGLDVRAANAKQINEVQRFFDELRSGQTKAISDNLNSVGTDGGIAATNERARAQLVEVNKVLDEERKKREETALGNAKIVSRMYEDMGMYGDQYWQATNLLLEDQVKKFIDAGTDAVTATQWKANKLIEIEEKITKKHNEENEKRKNALERWVDNYSDMGNVWSELADNSASGLNSLAASMTDFEKTGEMNWRNWLDSLYTSYLDTINKMIIANIAKGAINPLLDAVGTGLGNIFAPSVNPNIETGGPNPNTLLTPAGGWHGGGVVGKDSPTFTRAVPSSLFANAPRLHGGLKSNERRAILEVGEEVTSKEDVRRGKISGNIYNFNISTPDADSFRRSKTQIMNDFRIVTR